jgi:uncharacterized protein (DUF58 family)
MAIAPVVGAQGTGRLSRYLDPRVLSRVERLELGARAIVEGFMAGAHRSPYYGFSVEFAEHREYTFGDDPRHLDWKVLAKSERYFLKQYEVETNFAAHILHDSSESMVYASPHAPCHKLEYANFLTACLAYLIAGQTDSVGLGIFNEGLVTFVEPRQSYAQVQRICAELERARPARKTDTGAILHEFAARIRKRGLVILVSDLLDSAARIVDGLDHLRFARHEAIVFHILDPFELEFPFDGLIRFEGLEARGEVLCQPRMVRQSYLRELHRHVLALRGACQRNNADYVLIHTGQPLEVALQSFLQSRALRQVRR